MLTFKLDQNMEEFDQNYINNIKSLQQWTLTVEYDQKYLHAGN